MTTRTFGVRRSRERAARCRAWADSLPENRWHGVIAGKLYIYASDAAFAAGPTESRSQEKGIPA